jgi:prepilin-type N-terminal cleavage/methylation domain-containing protein
MAFRIISMVIDTAMKFHTRHSVPRQKPKPGGGFTLIEMLMASGILSLLIVMLTTLGFFTARSFVTMGNYMDLDDQSRNTADMLGRDIRNASALLSYTNTSTLESLTFTNATLGQTTTIKYDPNARTVVVSQNTGGTTVVQTNLTQCDQWNFALYSRAPNTNSFSTNIVFFSTANASLCKVVDLTWQCSRTIFGAKVNTESVQTAQIVLRNQVQY